MEAEIGNDYKNVINDLIELNTIKGNKGLLNAIDTFFLTLVESNTMEDMQGSERGEITMIYLGLKNLITKSSNLKEIDLERGSELDYVRYLTSKNLIEDFVSFNSKK